jgi:hypothetical protein
MLDVNYGVAAKRALWLGGGIAVAISIAAIPLNFYLTNQNLGSAIAEVLVPVAAASFAGLGLDAIKRNLLGHAMVLSIAAAALMCGEVFLLNSHGAQAYHQLTLAVSDAGFARWQNLTHLVGALVLLAVFGCVLLLGALCALILADQRRLLNKQAPLSQTRQAAR